MIAFVFPGQGSQHMGMGLELYNEFAIARKTFEEANDTLGVDISGLCFEDKSEELRLTINSQPAILTVSVAALRVLSDETGLKADYVAGHSLGEYTALVASDSFEFSDALRVVRKRGEFMQNAVPVGVGSMSAILGLDDRLIEEICLKVSRDGSIVSPANFNAPGQVVISGNVEAVETASELAKKNGAKKIIPLEVSAPFHCALMQPAAERLSRVLEDISVSGLKIPIVRNIDARINSDSSKVKGNLVEQVTSPVRWHESIECLYEMGVRRFLEIGPGKVLSGLIKRSVQDPIVSNIENLTQLQSLKEKGY